MLRLQNTTRNACRIYSELKSESNFSVFRILAKLHMLHPGDRPSPLVFSLLSINISCVRCMRRYSSGYQNGILFRCWECYI